MTATERVPACSRCARVWNRSSPLTPWGGIEPARFLGVFLLPSMLFRALSLDFTRHLRDVRRVQKAARRLGMRIVFKCRPPNPPQRGDRGFLPRVIVDTATLFRCASADPTTVHLHASDGDRLFGGRRQLAPLMEPRVPLAPGEQLVADLLSDPHHRHHADLLSLQLEERSPGLLARLTAGPREGDLVDHRRVVAALANLECDPLREKSPLTLRAVTDRFGPRERPLFGRDSSLSLLL